MNCKSCRKRKVWKPRITECFDSKVLFYDPVPLNIN